MSQELKGYILNRTEPFFSFACLSVSLHLKIIAASVMKTFLELQPDLDISE